MKNEINLFKDNLEKEDKCNNELINYYNEIKNKIIENELFSKVKDYSKEKHKVIVYYEIGKILFEAGWKYGDAIIEEYSKKLVLEIGKKYNKRTLFRMKQFYKVFSNEKVIIFRRGFSYGLILSRMWQERQGISWIYLWSSQ